MKRYEGCSGISGWLIGHAGWFIVILAMLLLVVSLGYSQDNEISIHYVIQKGHCNGSISYAREAPINDWLSVRAKGEIGSMWYEDSDGIHMGILSILRATYEYLYFDVGVGIGYTEGGGSVRTGSSGIVESGAGVILPMGDKEFLIGYQFQHISSLKPGDRGANMHGVVVGIRW